MSSPSNVRGMVARFELLGTPQDGFHLLGSLPQPGESWNKKLKKRKNSSINKLFRYMDFYCPDQKAPNPIKLRGNGQCQRCCFCLDLLTRDDPTATDDEDDEDMPELIDVSSSFNISGAAHAA